MSTLPKRTTEGPNHSNLYEQHPNRFKLNSFSYHNIILVQMLTISSILGYVSSFTTTTTKAFMNYPALPRNHPLYIQQKQQRYFQPLQSSIRKNRIQSLQTITTTRSTTTQLYMAVTKSGGRPISSNEQFQLEVLNNIAAGSIDDSSVDDINLEEENELGEETKDTAATTVVEDKPVLVFFSAPWCGPCRLSNPVVKEIIKEYVPIIDVVEVCTDDLPDVAENAGVVSIPTIQLYYKGELMDTIVGCVAKNVLSAAVLKVLEDLGFEEVEEDEEDDDDSMEDEEDEEEYSEE